MECNHGCLISSLKMLGHECIISISFLLLLKIASHSALHVGMYASVIFGLPTTLTPTSTADVEHHIPNKNSELIQSTSQKHTPIPMKPTATSRKTSIDIPKTIKFTSKPTTYIPISTETTSQHIHSRTPADNSKPDKMTKTTGLPKSRVISTTDQIIEQTDAQKQTDMLKQSYIPKTDHISKQYDVMESGNSDMPDRILKQFDIMKSGGNSWADRMSRKNNIQRSSYDPNQANIPRKTRIPRSSDILKKGRVQFTGSIEFVEPGWDSKESKSSTSAKIPKKPIIHKLSTFPKRRESLRSKSISSMKVDDRTLFVDATKPSQTTAIIGETQKIAMQLSPIEKRLELASKMRIIADSNKHVTVPTHTGKKADVISGAMTDPATTNINVMIGRRKRIIKVAAIVITLLIVIVSSCTLFIFVLTVKKRADILFNHRYEHDSASDPVRTFRLDDESKINDKDSSDYHVNWLLPNDQSDEQESHDKQKIISSDEIVSNSTDDK